jgi:hypothetical protein
VALLLGCCNFRIGAVTLIPTLMLSCRMGLLGRRIMLGMTRRCCALESGLEGVGEVFGEAVRPRIWMAKR